MHLVATEDWAGGIISLVNSARAKGIIPSAIVLAMVAVEDEDEKDDKIQIILWGDV